MSQPGIEPGLRASRARVRSDTLQGHVVSKYLAWESNPVLRFHKPPCKPLHLQGLFSTPPRNRTPSDRIEVCHAVHHTRRACVSTPTWNRTRTKTLGGAYAIHYTIGTQEPTTGFAPASTGLQDRRLANSSHVGKTAPRPAGRRRTYS